MTSTPPPPEPTEDPAEPWVVFEDEDLLAVNKPAGVNTHRTDTHSQDGLYEWVARQRPQAKLALLHRLDKGTSGVILFGKSEVANRSLAKQLAEREVRKRYLLLARADPKRDKRLRCDQSIVTKRKGKSTEQEAVTDFEHLARGERFDAYVASPRTGRRHQIRLHAARLGLPIAGDVDYGGAPGARVWLHAERLTLRHPRSDDELVVEVAPPASVGRVLGGEDPSSTRLLAAVAREAREHLFERERTDAWLWIDRDHDGFPDLRVEHLGGVARVLRYDDRPERLPQACVEALIAEGATAVVEQRRPREGGGVAAKTLAGSVEGRFAVRELGLRYWIDLAASPTSSGLFLDQRETRRTLTRLDLSGKTMLNAFAHTGSLSVAGASAGAETLTLDLSKRYLEWARENLELNGLDAGDHDFVYGDALDWLRRFAKKGRRFDVVLIDPPSSSTSGKGRKKRRWVVERDLGELAERGARLTAPGGVLYVSTNLRRMTWPSFLEHLAQGLRAAGRKAKVETVTLPLDYRSGPQDPPYLKGAWLRLD